MEDSQRVKVDKDNLKFHPRDRAGLLSKTFFCWAVPLFVKGYKKDLTEHDLYKPLRSHESERLGDQFEEAWDLEKKLRSNPSLWRVIFKVHWKELAFLLLAPVIMNLIFKMSQPIFLQKLMEYYVPNQTSVTKSDAYLFASLLVLMSLLYALMINAYILSTQHVGMRVKVALCSLVYRKILRLRKSALEQTTTGQIINLMSNDVRRFNGFFMLLLDLCVAPFEIALVVYLIYRNLGPIALSGCVVLLLLIPMQTYVGNKSSKYRRKTALKTDLRVRLMNEIICGIQVIKMYAWEKPFSKLMEKARNLEVLQVRSASFLGAINTSLMEFLKNMSVFLCVLVYVLTGNALQAQYLYVVMSFYVVLCDPLVYSVPRGITVLIETNVSIKRFEEFLSCDEVRRVAENSGPMEGKKGGVCMAGLSSSWVNETSDGCSLNDIDFDVQPEETVAVVGVVGSGKSTLLQVILKELPHSQGKLEVLGSISYAPQEAWIFASSIRQNILFGQRMDEERYTEVVRVCALERDLELFPYGDKTIVGERGVMLSGGQKARVSLARAVYKEADIYLLDDPLSAVDTHVGKHLFDECILGYLKKKTVVLVTHQLQYLRDVDKMFVINGGRIVASGGYEKIQSEGNEFIHLLLDRVGSSVKEKEEVLDDVTKSAEGEVDTKKELPDEEEEQRATGKVSTRIYGSYFRAGGGWFYTLFTFLMFAVYQVLNTGGDYFLAFWVNKEQDRLEQQEPSNSLLFLYIYTSIILFAITMTMLASLNFFKYSLTAAQNLHNRMFSNIVYAALRFFHTNPSGRILNRFSKDIGSIDEVLPNLIKDIVEIGLHGIAVTAIISFVSVWLLIPTAVIFVLFYGYSRFYLATSRDLKRIEGTSRSPVFSHTTASLQGLTTIRALKAQGILQKEFDQFQDLHSSAFYTLIGCSRAFAFCLDLNCSMYSAIVILSFLFIGTETYGGNVGFAITQSITLSGYIQWAIRQWSELENQMTSVERVVEYTEIVPEPTNLSKNLPLDWPSRGTIEFQAVSLRYSPTDPYVLKNLRFKIESTEKIGIVGRTGAGKSSLISALFRLTDTEGAILIDDINTKEISLNTLRSKISIIPQEPVLFSGTLRRNLDPFEEYDDPKLWEALGEVELKSAIEDLPSGLHCAVTDGGSNFSVGQRQLMCLARAVIRKNKILVLDEATANVDPQTDELIQKTIRKKFADCTVLTVAHRLHTVMDSDKILVMDEGVCVEMDHPYLLLQRKGFFYGLVMQTGKSMAKDLEEIARKCYDDTLRNELGESTL